MIITKQTVRDKLLAYLNDQISLGELVNWAENTFIDDILEPPADTEMLNDILGYLAAADTRQLPLTWAICADFLKQLGVRIQVVPIDKAS
jgi:hypothetical protein